MMNLQMFSRPLLFVEQPKEENVLLKIDIEAALVLCSIRGWRYPNRGNRTNLPVKPSL